MNREIKFRVRNIKTKELIGYERINEQGHWEQQRIGRKEWLLGVMTDGQVGLEFIREQYTGLNDKNGVEIYEGDVIQGEPIYGISHSAVRGRVSFSEENGAWMGYDLNANEGEFLYQIRKGCENFIVIGNIYQNPELIKTA